MIKASPHRSLYEKYSYAPNLPNWLIGESLKPLDAFSKLYGEKFNLIISHTENYARMKGDTNYLLFLENKKCSIGVTFFSFFLALNLLIIYSFTLEF